MKPATHITEFTDGSLGSLSLPADVLDGPGGAMDERPAGLRPVLGAAPSRLADFYELTKPRMNFLVVVTTLVGYYMASRNGVPMHWLKLLNTILGTAITAAGASVLNQYVERDLDGLMPRTANRPLPGGRIAPREALLLGIGCGVGGVLCLAACVNLLTAALGAITLLTYVFAYTPLKRRTTLCTIVGAVPGAIPPMMGWAAQSGTLSAEAIAMFAILFLWQMPHFLAIAIMYKDDYAAGGMLMLPVVDPGLHSTGRQIVLYCMALIPISLMPVGLKMSGGIYMAAAVALGLVFLGYGVSCAVSKRRIDARKLFFVSIIYLPLLLAAMMLDKP